MIVNDYRKRRPNSQIFSDRSFECTSQLEMEMAWWCRYNLSPSSVYVYQSDPYTRWEYQTVDFKEINISSKTSSGMRSIVVIHSRFLPRPHNSVVSAVTTWTRTLSKYRPWQHCRNIRAFARAAGARGEQTVTNRIFASIQSAGPEIWCSMYN